MLQFVLSLIGHVLLYPHRIVNGLSFQYSDGAIANVGTGRCWPYGSYLPCLTSFPLPSLLSYDEVLLAEPGELLIETRFGADPMNGRDI